MDTTNDENTHEEQEVDEGVTTITSNFQTESSTSVKEVQIKKEEETLTDNNLTSDKKMLSEESSRSLKRKHVFPPFWALHPYKWGKWRLCARAEQKLNVVQYSSKNSSKKRMKLLLVDAEGSKMESSMYDGEIDRLEKLVEEGKVYSFTGVDVRTAGSQYRLVNSERIESRELTTYGKHQFSAQEYLYQIVLQEVTTVENLSEEVDITFPPYPIVPTIKEIMGIKYGKYLTDYCF